MALLLAQQQNAGTWEGIEEFTASYRQAVITHAANTCPDAMVECFESVEEYLRGMLRELEQITEMFENGMERIDSAAEPKGLRRFVEECYEQIYRHTVLFHSPTAFFEMSTALTKRYAERVIALTQQQSIDSLPSFVLLALGPVGRHEATRFCRMPLVLVAENGTDDRMLERIGGTIVSWMRASGTPIEEGVSPLNRFWRGTLDDWRERFEAALAGRDRGTYIELLRLADQSVLAGDSELAASFQQLTMTQLNDRAIIGNLASRSLMLTNGLSMMGKLKVERGGAHQGLFPLLDHAFLPLASALSALAILFDLRDVGTPERIRSLVRIGRMDVDLAERILHAWQCVSEHRLLLEQQATIGQDCRDILNLNPMNLNAIEEDRLIKALETISDLQRYLQVCCGGYL